MSTIEHKTKATPTKLAGGMNLLHFKQLIQKPTIVDVGAVWCTPCKQFAPKFAALHAMNPMTYFLKLDCEVDEDVMKYIGTTKAGVIDTVPTILLFNKGVFVSRCDASVSSIVKAAKEHLKINLMKPLSASR